MQNNTVQAAAQQEKEALMSVRLLSLPWGDAEWGGAWGAARWAGEFPIRVAHSQWWLPLSLPRAQHAYSTGILAAVQFRELEDLQTEHPSFIEEGA